MKLKVLLPFIIAISLMLLSYTTSTMMYNPNCPTGYTGAPSFSTGAVAQCTSCHGAGLAGGSVAVSGLPSGSFIPGQTYNFSLTITHSAANRAVWGYAIKAISNVDRAVVGTFSTTNANSSIKSSGNSLELSHATAATSAASISYTYTNLKWTAPAVPTTNQSNIRFYFIGVAGNSNGGSSGDFVYSGTQDATYINLPVVLSNFKLVNVRNSSIQVLWQTEQETAGEKFEIETSIDAINWSSVSTVLAKGSSTAQQYSYTHNQPLSSGNVNYYRIKMIEVDGSYRYSAIQSIKLNNKAITIKPLGSTVSFGLNQTIGYSIQSDKNRTINVSIIDINGKILYNKQMNLMSGNNNVIIPSNAFGNSRGLVFAQFNADDFQETMKQIIF